MNTRVITAFLVLGMVAALFFTYVRPSHRLLAPVVGRPAAAQIPDANLVAVKSVPNMSTIDDLWQHFEVTVPPTNPPLDMHLAFLVDGKGIDYITKESMPWQQKIPLKFRVDQDDDQRIKAILQAQSLPVNSRLVTYHFSYRSSGGADSDETLKFLHSSGGSGGIEQPAQANARVGDRIALYQSAVYDDSAFHSPLYRPLANWHPEGYAKNFPPGFVHRLSVYLQFQPHKGRPVNNAVVYDDGPVRLPDNFDVTKI